MNGAAIAQSRLSEPRIGNRPVHLLVDSDPPTLRQESRTQATVPITWHGSERAPMQEMMAAASGAGCTSCHARRFCMPAGYDAKMASALKGVFGQSRKVKRGSAIFRTGERFRNLYVVKVGASKTVAVNNDGREHITGFQIAGEFIGMEGISTGRHELDAVALEDSVVCSVPFDALSRLGERDFGLRNHLHKLMSRELLRESALLMLMGRMNAVEKLVAFLLNLSKRYADRGYSAHEFNLRMTREEIGCHLGLTLETVSRLFSRLSSLGLIQCSGKQISITDMAGLEQIHRHCIPE
ncbi:helix-turn-helix domain-containing protein [Paraburkholderia sp. HP33-1]|uniref:helix-turn-helix domain-containing protein n=1 Tax=Paraburkholderia sp. HP33-1 TaxID=2883243 RepID=UPI001F39F39A|nr:helix-turn-helix domain-containing protein [Paraburkholderia sp. HP33-1]